MENVDANFGISVLVFELKLHGTGQINRQTDGRTGARNAAC